MAKKTPKQEVVERFGSKDKLAEALIPLLEKKEGVDQADFEKSIKTASNTKLLRLHATQTLVKRQFGTKERLVDQIVEKKFPGGNADYRNKLLTLLPSRLLDLHRSAS